MMRKITIIGAILVGLVGLLMSLCGGASFAIMAYGTISDIVRSGRYQAINGLVLLIIPAIFVVGGGAIFWVCFKYLRRQDEQSRKDNNSA